MCVFVCAQGSQLFPEPVTQIVVVVRVCVCVCVWSTSDTKSTVERTGVHRHGSDLLWTTSTDPCRGVGTCHHHW